MQNPSLPSAKAPFIQNPKLQLFLICCFSLYLELIAIRWLSSEIRIFAFLKNIPLITCFLSLGLGIMLQQPKHSLKAHVPCLLGLFILCLALAPLLGLSTINIPVAKDLWIWQSSEPFAAKMLGSIEGVMRSILSYIIIISLYLSLLFSLFLGVGQMIGERLKAFNPLQAYHIDLLGSICGVLLFTGVSFLHLTPLSWFLIGLALFLLIKRVSFQELGLIAFGLAVLAVSSLNTHWSPYYRIQVDNEFTDGRGRVTSYLLDVNNTFFQHMGNHSNDLLKAQPFSNLHAAAANYNLPYQFIKNPGDVLIVGAGTGNDVAAALRHGARSIDAVEIDPLIIALGSELHPTQPYSDTRVTKIVDDARSFFEKSTKQYDTIVYGLLDSHTSVSAFSNVRLDNFVYTLESFQAARKHLKPGGSVILSFAANAPWILQRLHIMLHAAFQQEPLIFSRVMRPGGIFVLNNNPDLEVLNQPLNTLVSYSDSQPRFESTPIKRLQMQPPQQTSLAIPTDDWPYLYLRHRSIPALYTGTLLLVIILMAFLVIRILGRDEARSVLLPRNKELVHFFLLGAAFLLIQTKSINELALLFGSTWIVNSCVIFGILLMAWLANALVRGGTRLTVTLIAVGLFSSLVAAYFIRPNTFSGDSFLTKFLLGGLLIALPLFFSGLLFSRSFEHTPQLTQAFGANLFGAFFGGILENASMITGMRALTFLAVGLYGLALILRPRAHEKASPL